MIQIVFDKNALITAGGVIEPKSPGSYLTVIIIDGQRIPLDEDIPIISDSNRFFRLPKGLKKFVLEVSLHDTFGTHLKPHRTLGVYRLRSAVTELEVTYGNKTEYYKVKILGDNIEDVNELFDLIREGQICPKSDFEREQVPPPFRHLRDLASEAWQLICRDVRAQLYRIKERINAAT